MSTPNDTRPEGSQADSLSADEHLVAPDHSSVEAILRDRLGAYHLHLNGVVNHEPLYGTDDDDSDLKPTERCDSHNHVELVRDLSWSLNRLIKAEKAAMLDRIEANRLLMDVVGTSRGTKLRLEAVPLSAIQEERDRL